jgi:hypothetical protein
MAAKLPVVLRKNAPANALSANKLREIIAMNATDQAQKFPSTKHQWALAIAM